MFQHRLVSLSVEFPRSSSLPKLNFIHIKKKHTLGSHGSRVLYVFGDKNYLQKTFGWKSTLICLFTVFVRRVRLTNCLRVVSPTSRFAYNIIFDNFELIRLFHKYAVHGYNSGRHQVIPAKWNYANWRALVFSKKMKFLYIARLQKIENACFLPIFWPESKVALSLCQT